MVEFLDYIESDGIPERKGPLPIPGPKPFQDFDHPCKGTCSGWQQGLERGVSKCVEEVNKWKELHDLSHKTVTEQKGWANQQDADREHGNTMRLLDCIISHMGKIK